MPNNYILLDRIELNANAASVTFDNIPQSGYTDLLLVSSARSATGSGNWDGVYVSFNGTSVTTNHSARRLYGFSSTAASDASLPYAGIIPSNATTASTFGSASMYIPNYRGNTNKSISVDASTENNSANAINFLTAGLWANTAAITSITLTTESASNFLANSTFSLYGLAQVGTTPAIAPKADGGNVIGTDGTYWYHAFLSNGTFTPQVGLSCDVIRVAGGGGAGGHIAGGGGAGGVLIDLAQSVTSARTITIGSGGLGNTYNFPASSQGTSGTDTTFTGLSNATGGGGGGGRDGSGQSGLNGGSGGGAASAGTPGTGLTGSQGFGGGFGSDTGSVPGGGGGGYGALGQPRSYNASSTNGGAGGVGITSSLINAIGAATGVGQLVSGNYYYAGGGGGATQAGSGGGAGGFGGGGLGGTNSVSGADGTVNLGGGGGGGGQLRKGGNGGSGIVIVRYLVA